MSRFAFRLMLSSLILAGPLAAEALATPIDFRQLPFSSAADGLAFFEISAGGIDLRFDPLPTPDATLYWDSTDGFGVRHAYEADEIEQDETLIISFTSGPVSLATVFLTDLFFEGDPLFAETGSYQLNGSGSWITFVQDDPTILSSPVSNGEFDLVLNAVNVSSIAFRAPGLVNGQGHEFSVAGIDATIPTPEPTTLLLFGGGLLGAATARHLRRRRAPPR